MRIISIDFGYLLRIPGSKDRTVIARVRPMIEDIWDPTDFEEDDDPPLAMPPEALDEIVKGEVPDEAFGEPYEQMGLWLKTAVERRHGLVGILDQ
jgi:hypothetical protein